LDVWVGDVCAHVSPLICLTSSVLSALLFGQYHVPRAAMLFRHNGCQRWNCGTCATLLGVREVLNFTKAAARLRVAQPALSRQVQDLEDEIGVDLTAT